MYISKKITTEEKKANVAAHDTLIKDVFDNLRNLFICISLAIAGGAVYKFRTELPLGSLLNLVIAFLVILVACGLLVWNMFHGLNKLIKTVKGTWNNWLLVSFAFVYVFALFTIFQALVMFKGK